MATNDSLAHPAHYNELMIVEQTEDDLMEPNRKPQKDLLYFLLLLAACMASSIAASYFLGGPWFGG